MLSPRRRLTRRPLYRKKNSIKKKIYRSRRIPRSITTNTAAVKECYSTPINDGNVVFFRNTQLADAAFDRSQAVAAAYQQFRVKYIKLTFRPSADTYPVVAGNVIPQIYFMFDKSNSIPTNADANTFFSMGARPRRMDDKNLVYAWKPTVLNTSLTQGGASTSADLMTRPWLSTNANAQNPIGAWAPSTVAHLGAAFYVTKINPADDLQYFMDVEVVFQFRKPVWRGSASSTSYQSIENGVTVTKTVQPSPPLQ